MKRGKKLLALALALTMVLSLSACSKGGDTGSGDVFRKLYGTEVSTLNYLFTSFTNDLEMCANMVDCLVEYDSYGVVQPSLAESWSANEDNTVWTFKLRPGLKWVDYTGKEVADVTAQDWVDAAKWVNNAANAASNQYMYNGIVKNAQEYFNYTAYLVESKDGTRTTNDEGEAIEVVEPVDFETVGVKAVDALTLEYTLAGPTPYFISVLSYASYMPVYGPFLEEQGDNFGIDNTKVLYNGAFIMTDYEPQNQRILKKNTSYWDKEHVYIDEMEWLFNTTATTLGPEQFVRGEVDWAQLDASILSAWLADPEKKDLVCNSRPNAGYSYFYTFNFEPRFDASLEPDNWVIAVNNENFRQSMAHGMDRVNAVKVQDPQSPEKLLTNTITPVGFASGDGLDYAQYPVLKPFTDTESFNATTALDYKAKAMPELTAAGCTFPIKVYMRYNPATPNMDKECQVVEQQMESLLGKDYIDIVVEAGPSTNFLSVVRRTGDYGFMKCNWGADYADPQTWTEPFVVDNTYNFMGQMPQRTVADKPCDSKTPETQALVSQYYDLVEKAKVITADERARYSTFAEAEALLIEHAFVIPLHKSTNGYLATKLNIFEAQYAPYGLALQRYKFQHVQDKAMSLDEFNNLYAAWETERAAAVAKAAQ